MNNSQINSKLSQTQYVELLRIIKELMQNTHQLLQLANQTQNVPLARFGLTIAYQIEQFNNSDVNQIFVGGYNEN